MKHRYSVLAASLLLTAGMAQAQDIARGGLDNFESETTEGWSHGAVSPNPPTVIPTGGNEGADDAYLENQSSGSPGPGGKHVFFNRDARWTGDYIAAGVNKIRVNVINFGPTEVVNLRLAFFGGAVRGGLPPCWVSTDAIVVPADSTWRNYSVLVDETTMTQVGGGATFEDTMRDVQEIRVLSAAAPQCQGDAFLGVSGYDDFQTTADTDLDGINDTEDNCTLQPNPPVCIGDASIDNEVDCTAATLSWGQVDSDADFYGNECDGDIAPDVDPPFLSGNCLVDFGDVGALKAAFLTNEGDANYDQEADLVYSSSIGFADVGRLKTQFLLPPGPGLGNCGCAPEPSALDPGEDFTGLELFVRGGMAFEWGAVPLINNVANLGSMEYQARLQITAGSYAFKIASEDWSLGYANVDVPTVVGDPPLNFTPQSGPGTDATITIAESGCYEFNFTANPVDPPEDPPVPAESIDVSVVGPLP
ncbi:MAG: hypothetical protein OEQ74_01580 [Gammaproteobacteria bacterium]|nr:hypothetical protein [Gammaproteobacteria bacterium]